MFTNLASNPLQKWKQGKWFACWEGEPEGDFTCTLSVSVAVQENKIKPRKGQAYGWHKLLEEIKDQIQLHSVDTIEAITLYSTHWHRLLFAEATTSTAVSEATSTHPNRFAVLSKENTPQHKTCNEVQRRSYHLNTEHP